MNRFWYVARTCSCDPIDFENAPTLLEETVEAGIQIWDLKAEHVEQLNQIRFLHMDPFDHILLATAISEQAALLTRDAEVLKYQGIGGLQIIRG